MKKGLKKPIALLLSAMMIFSTSASAFPAMAEDNLIFEKAENNTIHSDNEFYNSESEITVTTCENKENPTETTTVSTTTEVSVQYSEEQTENNPVEVYNGDYAVYAVSSSDEYEQPEGDGTQSNPYQISNSSQLFWFAQQVNKKGKTSINAVLTEDIIVNENIFDEDGNLNSSSTPTKWTPIGNESNKYIGTFDGNNHTISGLYFNNNTTYVGLFGYNSSGTIKNVGIIDSYFKGFNCVGSVCGSNYGTVENSYNTGLVSGSSTVGGVCGNNFGTIENSYNTGSVSGSKNVGGVCGFNYYGVTIKNSYNTGSISGSSDYVGGVCGKNYGIIENSYYLENCNAEGTTFDCNEGTEQTSEQFENGEVAYLLGEIWGQEIGTDKLPVLNGKKVYENKTCSGCCEKYQGDVIKCEYSNTQKDAVYLGNHNFENGICTGCGTYEPAQLVDNYYQISNAGNLLWFAKQVNSGNKGINAVLTADIVVNQNVLNSDGTLNNSLTGLVEWTPIGNESNKYTGTFDGNNHTISGLYFNNSTDYVGLFGYNSGTIKNIGIIDSYFKGNNCVGGVCGGNWNDIVENSYGTIENSYNTGSVSGLGNSVGGVCGNNYNKGTIKNSYNTGSVSGSNMVGGVCGWNYKGTIENSYYLENCNAEGTTFTNNDGTEKTYAQFESGEVAYLLGGIWGQEIGIDKLPVLNSENKVYKVIAYSSIENEIISEIYLNNSLTVIMTVVAPIKEGYNFKGWYTYDETAEKHYTGNVICSSREYNNSNVTADSEFIAVYEPLGTASITINCDREYTINGESQSSVTTENYLIGSTITLSCSDKNFAYWQNSAGTILSRESEYSFVVTGNETISAVFNEKVDNKVTLIFESFYGQVIATEQLGSGEKMATPDLPVRTGYNALGWDYNGDGKYDKNDTLENAIKIGLRLDSKTVKIVPVYELINETYKITVENGEGSGEYNQNDIVTATPNKAETGMKFSHWEDSDGNVLSYNEKYVFYVSKDMTVKAIYVETGAKVNAKGTTGIVELNKTTNNKLSFVSMSTVPEGCKINKAGIIATDDSNIGKSNNFTDKNAKFVRGMSSDKKAVRYTWTKGKVQSGETWYVRAYLVYTDSNGNVHTVYGDMVSQTY